MGSTKFSKRQSVASFRTVIQHRAFDDPSPSKQRQSQLSALPCSAHRLSNTLGPGPAHQEMIGAITLLLVFQLAGEVISRSLGLPIPGPVIGMALLFLGLAMRGGPSTNLRNTAQGLLQHLSLLFVPAGTGVMLHFQRMSDEWLPLLASLLVSTAVTIGVTAVVLRALIHRTRTRQDLP